MIKPYQCGTRKGHPEHCVLDHCKYPNCPKVYDISPIIKRLKEEDKRRNNDDRSYDNL